MAYRRIIKEKLAEKGNKRGEPEIEKPVFSTPCKIILKNHEDEEGRREDATVRPKEALHESSRNIIEQNTHEARSKGNELA